MTFHFKPLINPSPQSHAGIHASTAVTERLSVDCQISGAKRVTLGSCKARVSRKSSAPWQSLQALLPRSTVFSTNDVTRGSLGTW